MKDVRFIAAHAMIDSKGQSVEVDEYGEVGSDGIARAATVARKRRLFMANGDTVVDRGHGRYEVIQTGEILRQPPRLALVEDAGAD